LKEDRLVVPKKEKETRGPRSFGHGRRTITKKTTVSKTVMEETKKKEIKKEERTPGGGKRVSFVEVMENQGGEIAKAGRGW